MSRKPKKALITDDDVDLDMDLEMDILQDEGPEPVKKTKHAQNKIEKKKFKKMLEMLATKDEVAGMFEVSVCSVERFCKEEFGETFETLKNRYGSRGKYSLRRAMYVKAVYEGNVQMQMHLSRHYLGMKDTVEIEGNEQKPLALTYSPNGIRDAVQLQTTEVINGKDKLQSEDAENLQPALENGRQEGEG